MSCPVPELPGVGCLLPEPTPTPTASPGPSPTAAPSPAPTPTSVVIDDSGMLSPAPSPTAVAGPVLGPTTLTPVAGPTPSVLPAVPAPTATATAVTPVSAVQGVPLSSVVPSAYAIVVFGVIGVALLVSFLSGLKPAGGTVKTTRTRLWAGLATIAAAAVVGGIGWYRISGEPLLNRQIPFLASAGIAVVVLAVLGGALVVAEQLRADQDRIGELESAVRALTEALAPVVENPARRAES